MEGIDGFLNPNDMGSAYKTHLPQILVSLLR